MPYFNPENPQHRELADAFDQGNYDQMPQAQVMSHLQSFLQNAPQHEVQQVQQDYFNQMPQAQRMGLFSSLIGALGQHGVDPRQAGINTTDPRQASSMDLGNLFGFAMNSGLLGNIMGGGNNPQPQQQGGGLGGILGGLLGGGNDQSQYQQPQQTQSGGSGLEGILSNPLARAAISGLLAYGANRAMKGFAQRGQSQQPHYNANQGQMQSYASNDVGGSALPGFEDDQSQTQTNSGGGSALPGFENTRREV